MPNTKLIVFSKFILLGVFGLILGGTGMLYYQKQHHSFRSIASVEPYHPHGLILGKQGAAMTVEIVGPQNYPESNSETVELVGYITQHLGATSSLNYEWSLPEGVELMRGPLSNNLNNLQIGRPQQVSLLVRGFSREKQKLISLKTQLMTGNALLTTSATIVSRPEDTTEAKVMDLQAQAKAAAEAARTSSREAENR
ncbi:MAG: hypothetical protein ACXWRE_08125 [Pseudobdellovibrionaceae bacterium]